MADSSAAASATVRAIGPAVSCEAAIGTIPSRLTSPTVGLMPTRPHFDAGDVIDPSVSVPTATGARLAATAAALPELDPLALRSSAYGLRVRPPRALQPLVERVERKLAHSLRLVLPRITAPASRSCATTKASRGAGTFASASEPALVLMRSRVAMLSFTRTGIPCSGPRGWPALRSRSRSAAMASASGWTSMTDAIRGPLRSIASMRARQAAASVRAVSRPASIRARSASIDVSRYGKRSAARAGAAKAAEAAAKEARKSLRRIGRRDSLHRLAHVLDDLLRVAEHHHRLRHVEEFIVEAGVAGRHRALFDDDLLRLVGLEDRHAGDRRLRVLRGRVHDVVGAEDQRDVGLAELAVDVLHLEHLVVRHLGFREQHVHVARHAARDRVDRVLHLHAPLDQLVREFLQRMLGPRHREAVARHDDHALRVRHQERRVVRRSGAHRTLLGLARHGRDLAAEAAE